MAMATSSRRRPEPASQATSDGQAQAGQGEDGHGQQTRRPTEDQPPRMPSTALSVREQVDGRQEA